jgi:hypothetical protein
MPILTQFIDDLGLLSQQTNHRTMKVETERIKIENSTTTRELPFDSSRYDVHVARR